MLAASPRQGVVAQTTVYDNQQRDAETLVHRIIQSNLGAAARSAKGA